MSHSCLHEVIDIPTDGKYIVLAGNPNVGKSVVFHLLTGVYVDVSNYPGTTVDITHGTFEKWPVVDTPGIYGVSSFNEEETVARDVIIDADLVVNVVDAVHLERDLFLTLQLLDMGKRVIVALNMMDELNRAGMSIDVSEMSRQLDVPVIPIVAVENKGVDELKAEIRKIANRFSGRERTSAAAAKRPSQAEKLLIREGDSEIAKRYGEQPGDQRDAIYTKRRERVNRVVSRVLKEKPVRSGSAWLSRLMVRPITGVPLLLLTLYLLYQIVGVFIAGTVVDFLEGTIMAGYYEPFVRGLLSQLLNPQGVVFEILAGEFGILTMTITYIFGLLLPLVAGFYLFLSLLEDSGYMPRIATLVDRVLTRLGLNGKAIIPMILGLGCVTMATITTRILGSRRERIIATMLLALAIPCSAQLGVVAGMLGELGGKYFAIYVSIIVGVFAVIGTLLNRILPGTSTDLLIDLPTLRFPRPINVLRKTFTKTKSFILEAGPLFLIGSLLISLLQISGLLEILQTVLAPLTVAWLKLPKETATAFIMGIVRRDFGAAGLYSMDLTPEQTLVSLLTITLFIPCMASMIVIIKERRWKESFLIIALCFLIAFTVGGVTARFV